MFGRGCCRGVLVLPWVAYEKALVLITWSTRLLIRHTPLKWHLLITPSFFRNSFLDFSQAPSCSLSCRNKQVGRCGSHSLFDWKWVSKHTNRHLKSLYSMMLCWTIWIIRGEGFNKKRGMSGEICIAVSLGQKAELSGPAQPFQRGRPEFSSHCSEMFPRCCSLGYTVPSTVVLVWSHGHAGRKCAAVWQRIWMIQHQKRGFSLHQVESRALW